MARRPRPRFTDEQRIKAFILRARRITAHSLWREHRELLEKMRVGQTYVTMTINPNTGETSYVKRDELPAEELLESLAARLRPLTLATEELHYAKVLDSVAALVPADQFPDYVEPIDFWRGLWAEVATRDERAQAYYVVTDQGVASDQDLMYAWYYGDVVHADDKEAEAKGLSVTERYKAAAGIVARIVECTDLTLLLVRTLVDEGVLGVDPELFEREVVVTQTVFEKPVRAFTSPTGTPLPLTDGPIDLEVWTPMVEAMAEHLPSVCQLWWATHTPRPSNGWTWKITPQRLSELLSVPS
ncbi:hypothetical protein GS483_19320 [Rhodococcus hoagii]|nr:hypothetical protein [Prescottella equi]